MVNFNNSTNDLTKQKIVKSGLRNLAGRRLKCAQSSSSKPGRLVSAKLKSLRRWRTWLYTSTFCLCCRLRVGAKSTALLLQLSVSSMITAKTTSRWKLWTGKRVAPLKGTARRRKRRRKFREKRQEWLLEIGSAWLLPLSPTSLSASSVVSWTVWFGYLNKRALSH